MIMPGGLGVRLDTHIYPSYVVPPFYDSMLGKLIVHAPTRKEAIKKMRMALEQFIVEGIKTNIEFQYLVMHHIDFIKGHYDTSFIARFIALIEGERNG
jgi:acetyl-CoA carboxylase, biotin carboxylase subunit